RCPRERDLAPVRPPGVVPERAMGTAGRCHARRRPAVRLLADPAHCPELPDHPAPWVAFRLFRSRALTGHVRERRALDLSTGKPKPADWRLQLCLLLRFRQRPG